MIRTGQAQQDLHPEERQGVPRRRFRQPDRGERRDLRLPRPLRLRQDHHPEDDQPDHPADLRPRADRRPGHRGPRRSHPAPPHRLRDPADRPVPEHDHRGKHHGRAAPARLGQGALQGEGPRADEHGQAGAQAVPATLPARTLRRPAAARRGNPRAGGGRAAAADGRAVRRGRSDQPRVDPERVLRNAAQARHDRDHGQPRHRRSHQAG